MLQLTQLHVIQQRSKAIHAYTHTPTPVVHVQVGSDHFTEAVCTCMYTCTLTWRHVVNSPWEAQMHVHPHISYKQCVQENIRTIHVPYKKRTVYLHVYIYSVVMYLGLN